MFDQICKLILCPPKFKYSLYDLGCSISKYGKRTDFTVYNCKDKKMSCSYYQPYSILFQRSCVIYLHSMNGSKLESTMYVQTLLKEGIPFCCFDFSGCGNSDGSNITFGANQKYDIESVVNKLRSQFYLNRFILWGRSMGSASAIKYTQYIYDQSKSSSFHQKQEIIGLILDSSFRSLSKLLVEIGCSQSDMPQFLVKAGYYLIKSHLQQKGQFKIQQLQLIFESINQKCPLEKLYRQDLPILFLASKDDTIVPCQHSIDMFDFYKCQNKWLKFFNGLHNESRGEQYIAEVLSFTKNILSNPKILNRTTENDKTNKTTNHQNNNFESKKQQKCPMSDSIKSTNQLVQGSQTRTKKPQIKATECKTSDKSLIAKLIQDQLYGKGTKFQKDRNIQEDQNMESTCMCSMFDSYNLPEVRVEKQVQSQLIEAQSKLQRSAGGSVGGRQAQLPRNNLPKRSHQQTVGYGTQSSRTNQYHATTSKKSITNNLYHTHAKSFQFHGPKNNSSGQSVYYSNSHLASYPQAQTGGLRKIVSQDQDQGIQDGLDNQSAIHCRQVREPDGRLFQELYKPLRSSSQASLFSSQKVPPRSLASMNQH